MINWYNDVGVISRKLRLYEYSFSALWQLNIVHTFWSARWRALFRHNSRPVLPYFHDSVWNVRHFPRPLVCLRSFEKFNAATLNPKNCFVFSFPLTGIRSTWYLLRRVDGSVSTPFRYLPANCITLSPFRQIASHARALAFNGISNTAVLFLSVGLHSSL